MAVDKAKSKTKKTQKPKRSRAAKPAQELLELKAQGDQALSSYDHQAAVEAYTRALELGRTQEGRLDAVTEYEILSGRATCHEYLGDVAAEASDLDAMAALAEKTDDLSRRIEVVIRQQGPMDQLGRADEVLEAAQMLADLARKSDDRQLLADGLRGLAYAYSSEGIQDAPNYTLYCEQALALYRELGDRHGEAFCLHGLGQAEGFVGQIDRARDLFAQALDLFRAVGDRKMEGLALVSLGVYATDQASRRDIYEQVLALATAVGFRPGIATMFNNLALLYAGLGLYDTARHHIEQSVEAMRGMGAKARLGTILESLGRILLDLGDLDGADDAYRECLSLAKEVRSRYLEGYAELGLGRVLIAYGHIEEGIPHLQTARQKFVELNNTPEIVTAWAYLADAQLAMGDAIMALESTNKAMMALKSSGDVSADYPPQFTWWTRYRALRAAGESDADEAWEALQRARDLTLTDIEKLSDQGLRRNYLNKVELNREILLEWTKEARSRGVWQPEESVREGYLQEQLKRMLAIGLKLNERRSTEELTEFIMEQFVELSGAERSALILTDESGGRKLASDRGFSSESQQTLIDHLSDLLDDVTASQNAALKQNVSPDDPSEPSSGFMDAVSVLCVPLAAHDQLLGMLYGDNHAVFGRFGEADVDLLSAFANQAAAAIENARLYQGLEDRVAERTSELNEANASLEHRAAELSVINSVQQGLASKLDFEKIIELVGTKIQEVFKSQGIAVRIYDPDTGLVHYPYEVDQGERLPAYPPQPAHGVTGHVIRTRQPLRINEDVEGWMEKLGASILPGSRTNKSLLAVPVIVKDQVRGTVQMEDDQEGAYTEADERLLSTIAASMGVALENARLFDETTRLLEETRQRNAELAVINSVQAGLASKLDLAGIVEVVGDKVAQILQTGDMTIRLLNDDGSLLITPYYLEHGDRFPVDPVPVEKIPIPAKALKTGKPVIASKEELEAAAQGGAATIGDPDSPMPASILYLPFMSGDKPRGLISVADVKRKDAYGESEIRLLTTLANSMSVALENARLFEETNRLLEETRQRNAELAVINRVQEGLASKLVFQAIIDLVGDEIYTIFPNESIGIGLFQGNPPQMHFSYWLTDGEQRRDELPPRPPLGFSKQVLESGRTVVHNDHVAEAAEEAGSVLLYDDVEWPKSVIFVPLRMEGDVRGLITLQNDEVEGVYNEPQIRLLESLASSLSVALENARLFDETTRLLEETRQRNAELAVINSVQEGLASKLDLAGVVEVVGEEIAKIFAGHDVKISLLSEDGAEFITPYLLEHGERFPVEPFPADSAFFSTRVLRSRKPLLLGPTDFEESLAKGVMTVGDPDSGFPKSELRLPILSGGKALGVITLGHRERENAYGESEINLLMTLANSMSVALENAHLFDETTHLLEETRQRNAELAVINKVQEGLASKLDLTGVVEVVGEEIAHILTSDNVAIALLSEDGRQVITPYFLEHGDRFPVGPIPIEDAQLTAEALETRQPVVVDLETQQRGMEAGGAVHGDPDSPLPKSMVFVPIISRDKAVGAISVADKDQENAYGPSEISLITTLANSMSVALENVHLFDETTRLLDETRQRNAELAVINKVQEGLASKLDLVGIGEVVGEEIARIFPGHDVTVALLSDDGQQLTHPFYLEHGERFPVEPRLVEEAVFAKRALEGKRPMKVDRAAMEEVLAAGNTPVGDLDSPLPLAELWVPILTGETPLGLIVLGNRETEDAYGPAETALVTTLANSMSVALENARLFDETKRLLDETRQRNAELAVINSVQEGLANELDMAAIFNLVGEKIREIFDAQSVDILTYDTKTNLCTYQYDIEKGERYETPPFAPAGFSGQILKSRQPLMFNEDLVSHMAEFGSHVLGESETPKAYLGVPLVRSDGAFGVISLQNVDRENAFSDSDLRLLTTLASSMSVALENARLFDETNRLLDVTRQHNAELAVINSVGKGLAEKLEFQAVIDLVGDRVREIFEADTTYIAVYDPKTERISFSYYVENDVNLLETVDLPGLAKGQGLTGEVLETRRPLRLGSMEEQTAHQGVAVVKPGEEMDLNQSYLAVPIFNGDQATGVISVQKYDENAFDEGDERLLSTLSSSMGVALENARLFEETNRLLEESRQHNLELAAVNTVSQALVAETELDKLIHLVGEQVRETFDADIAYVAIYDDKEQVINFPYLHGEGQIESMPFGSGMTSQVIRTGEPLLLNRDLDAAAAKMETERQGTRAKSYLGVPIKLSSQTIGVVSVQSTQEQDRFDDADVRLLETIAANAGAAIGSARLYEETKQRASELAAINVIGEGLLSQMDLERVVELVGESFSEIFEADDFGIGIYDQQSQMIRVLYDFHLGQRMPTNEIPYGQGLTSIVLETHRPLMLNTWEDMVNQGTVILNPELVEGEIRNASWLGVPIMSGRDITGAMFCTRYRDHAFDDADLRLLSTIAANMGVAIRNARLYEETRQRASELAAINVIGEALLSQMDLDRVIELVGDSISEIFEADDFAIAICDYEEQKIRTPYWMSMGKRVPPVELDLGEGLVSIVVDTKRPLVLKNWDELREHNVVIHPDARAGKADERFYKENSWLGVPIMSGTEVSGVIFGNRHRNNAFDDSDVRLLSTIAANMGVAIRNAQLYSETQRRAEEMAALNEIGKEASASLDLPTVLARITNNAGRLLSAHTTAVILVDEDGLNLRAAAAQGEMEQEVKDFTWRIGQGLIGAIVQSGQAERVNNTAEDPRTIELPGTEETVQGEKLLVAPLITRERAVGAVAAWRGAEDPAFGQDDISFAEGLAQQAAIAIQNAQLFEEAERRAGQMAALNELGREISATLDLETVLNLIAAQSRDLLNGDTSAVFMLQPDDKTLKVIAADGRIADEVRAMTAELGRGMVGSIAESGEAEVINDVSADSRGVHIPGTSTESQNQKLMAAPLLTKDAVLGVMAIWRGAEQPAFTQADLIFLAGLARQATVAIENARLFDETQRQRDYSGALVENSPVAIVTTDLSGDVVSWNPAAERLFAYSAEEAIGHNIDELITTEELRQEAVEYTEHVFDQGRVNAVTRRARKDGSEVDVELLALPVSVNGTHTGLIAIYHDITELLQAQREAETANQAKSAFLATMSHEIRTPMNAVIGMSGLLLDTELDPEQHEFAEIIRNSGDALLAIINDVLDFSKIEAGKMDLENQPFDLRECIEGTLDLVATKATEKGLDLAYVIEDGIPAGIVGDVTRLRQILLNLLTNAVKFTEEGEVVLTVQPQQEPPEDDGGAPAWPTLHFTVHDTGIGIPVERMDRLFQSFSQVDASTARKYGGTGLGLAISKRLSEMMGGTMWVESKLGVGTSFHFTIRAEASEDIAPSSRRMKHADPSLQGRRVLIVDDNDTNRRILTLQTERWGLIPRDTASPKMALEWIRKGDPFDIAILDMHMPEMDGLTLASEIRQLLSADELPLILFTSLGRRETGADELDFAAFLTKPIKPSHLFDSLVSIFADHPVAVRQPSREPQKLDPDMARRHPLHILLAEDNAVNQKLAVRLLAQMGYRADVAANGLEAVESLERQTYDVVLMDVQMPEMDGLEASRQINRRWAANERPRIVAMTANAMQGDRELCIAAGMDDYITKPIRVGELVAALEKVPSARSQEGHD